MSSMRKRHSSRKITPGATLGQFRVVRIVARRPGIDTLVEAQNASGARVGVTVLGDAFDRDPALRDATLKLVRTRAELAHPNLLPLRGPWQSSGRIFYASVPPGRKTLADRLQAGALEPADALRLAADVAAALELAARKGVVHRDLRPGAIELREGADERALLGDFGITLPFGPGCELLRTSGCLDYRSPEELRGERPRPRSNVYALACILVECLTGAPPHRYDRPLLTLHAHLVEPPPRVSERVEGLPERFDAVIAQGLAKDPRERFRSPAQLVEAAAKALELDTRMPLAEAARNQRARDRTVARERRRAKRRARRTSGRGRFALGVGAALRRRPSRVPVWAGLALCASAMSGFATGSVDWPGADRAPTGKSAPPAISGFAAERPAAHAERVEYLRRVNQTVAQLGERRAKARRALRDARRASHQAAAATALAGAYRRARTAGPTDAPAPFARIRLAGSLRDAELSYRSLAAAARKGDRRAWLTARRGAVRSERRLARALAELRIPGDET
jgi:Protein kinase domain